MALPDSMLAAVYRAPGALQLERMPVPRLRAGEVLVRVGACGVCATDVKKIMQGLFQAPRIFGHETAGRIVKSRATRGVWAVGDRVALYHHVPRRDSWYGRRRLYAQDPQYKRTGITAGYEPAGGGFAQFVRVLPWIVQEGGLTAIPDHVDYELAAFLEPVNTCLKAVRSLDLQEGELLAVLGLGSTGLILLQLALREGARVVASDPLPGRRSRALALGAHAALDPRIQSLMEACRKHSEDRGADRAIVAAPGESAVQDALAATRPGARILLFANTYRGESARLDVGELCTQEKHLCGSYSASVDLAAEAAEIVFGEQITLRALISHRFDPARTAEAVQLASQPSDQLCKVMLVHEEPPVG